MKTVGIIGGIGPESTIEYYRTIIAAYRSAKPDGSYPPIIVNSIDLKRMLDMIGAGQQREVAAYLLDEIEKLARGGADFGALAANTPHVVFDELRRRSPIPLISIVESVCEAASDLGLRNVGLFGTRFTMQGRFYPDVFVRRGVALTVPDPADQDYIHTAYMEELVRGVFLPETRVRLLNIADGMLERKGIQGLILGGTELPLILHETSYKGIPLLDTTSIHVRKIITAMLS